MSRTFPELVPIAMEEIKTILCNVEQDAFDQFCRAVAQSKRISLYGLGREGLALRGFCMRLMHLGLDAQFAGDITAGPIGDSDLLIVTSGPGNLTLTRAMILLGRQAGATVAVITAQPNQPDPQAADIVLTIPAQTTASDRSGESLLAMGTAFEIAMGIVFDLAVLQLMDLRGTDPEAMRARHTNLE